MEILEENATDDNRKTLFTFPQKKLVRIIAIIFIVTASWFTVQAVMTKEPVLTGNEISHIFLLNTIITEGRFDSIYFSQGADVSYYKGKYYSNKPPGYSFFLTPAYFLYPKAFGASRPFGWRDSKDQRYDTFYFMKFSNVIISTLIVITFALFLSTFKLSTEALAFGVIAAAFGTVFPAYTVLVTSIPLSILLSISSVFFYRLFRLDGGNLIFWTISIFCAITALVVDYSNGFFLFPLLIFAFIDTKLKLKFLIPVMIASIPGWFLLYYNNHIFETPFVLTYSYYVPPDYVEWENVRKSLKLSSMPRGFYGLLLSPERGLFLLSPVAVFGILAYRRIFKSRCFDLKITALMALAAIFILTAYSLWHGGHSMGYRHILVSAMVIASLSAFFFDSAGRPVKIAAVIILLFSCFTGLMSFFIELDVELLMLTWKAEPADVHSNFYTELLLPYIRKYW